MSEPRNAQTSGALADTYNGGIDVGQRTCNIAGCSGRVVAWGWCDLHYRRWRRHGNPLCGRVGPGTIPVCTVAGCDRKHYGRGWCKLHYERWRAHGDPSYRLPTLLERLWAKVERRGPDECWPWTAARSSLGYPYIGVGQEKRLASRVIVEAERGAPIPPGLGVLHSCDNPPCCNPAHLSLGTHKQNMEDMARKQRNRRGSQHPIAVLTEADVVEIRRLVAEGTTQRSLAGQHGVATGTIADIVYRRTWVHV